MAHGIKGLPRFRHQKRSSQHVISNPHGGAKIIHSLCMSSASTQRPQPPRLCERLFVNAAASGAATASRSFATATRHPDLQNGTSHQCNSKVCHVAWETQGIPAPTPEYRKPRSCEASGPENSLQRHRYLEQYGRI